MKDKQTLASLFRTFLKIGAFTFGGGYAMIPLIQREAVEKHQWISDGDILDIVAIAESTPGPIAINAATFVGYKVAGFQGALCATLGVVLPSFGIILAVALVLRQFQQLAVVQYAFWGIRAGVLALIGKALLNMYRQCPQNAVSWAIGLAALAGVALFGWNVLAVIVLAAVTGLVFYLAAQRRKPL